jgi:Family of unknown function (DUF6599)
VRVNIMIGRCIGVILIVLIAANAAAQRASGNLSRYLPASDEISGWKLNDTPQNYRGDELFLMINGGAGIYHEYGFTQVLRAEYVDAGGKSINLEIYEMESPAAAYGIYTFKSSDSGKTLSIGNEALLQDYYLNFWKRNLLVTVIGLDSEERTVQGVVAMAKAVDARITSTGDRPELADLLLGEPIGFSHPKYVRGPLGLMGSYIFDAENIFRVREGMIGVVGDCQAFVFRYADEGESIKIFKDAVARLNDSPKFTNRTLQLSRYSMVGPEKERVVINQTGRYITIVVGQNQDKVEFTANRLIEQLKSG